MPEGFIGNYRIREKVSLTRWGRLYSAQSPDGGKVAVKVFDLSGSLSAATGSEREAVWRRRFEQEAWLLGEIDHPNVVPLIDRGSDETGRPFFVMPFIAANLVAEIGGDIGSKAEVARLAPIRRPKPLSSARVIALLRQILRGVDALHGLEIVHRDLKPGNILLTRPRNGRARIADLGMASVNGRPLDVPDERIGTHGYVAPEVAADPASADKRSDVFTLGLIAFRMLSGRLPGAGDRYPRDAVPGVFSPIDEHVAAALAPAPDDRPADAADLLHRIEGEL